jgi:hypothetical protein
MMSGLGAHQMIRAREGHLDKYTKVVLTVIAVALCVIAFENFPIPAFAQSFNRVELCGQELNRGASASISCAMFLTDNDGVRRLVVTR